MLIVYDSRTGNVKRFVARLDLPAVPVEEEAVLEEPFVLVTHTTGFGQVPPRTAAFLARNGRYLRGVAASGNRNWGENFARSADRIAAAFGVPVLHKFELSGTAADVETLRGRVVGLAAY